MPSQCYLCHQYSFQSLPQELVIEIFIYCRVNAVSRQTRRATHLRNMIQRLRLVCPHWNHIIENTPALWIHIIIGDGRKRSLPPFRAWTSQSVSLLKNATLHIEIEYLHVKAKSYGEIMNAMENILLPVLNRWGTCRLSYATSCIEHHVELFNRAAPRLKSFVVEPDPDTPEDEVLPITRLFDNHAPQLHTLSIPTLALSWDSPILTNLTHLRILAWDGERMPTEDQYYKILNSNPGLTLLWIEGRIEDLDQPGIDFRFDAVMPQLHMIELACLPHQTCQSILSSIRSQEWIAVSLRAVPGNPLVGIEGAELLKPVFRGSEHTLKVEWEDEEYKIMLNSWVSPSGNCGQLYWRSTDRRLANEILLTLITEPYNLDVTHLGLKGTDELFQFPETLTMQQFLGRLPGVEVFDASECSGWLDALRKPHPFADDPRSFHWLLPEIISLGIGDNNTLLELLEARYSINENRIAERLREGCKPPSDLVCIRYAHGLGEAEEKWEREGDNIQARIVDIVGEYAFVQRKAF